MRVPIDTSAVRFVSTAPREADVDNATKTPKLDERGRTHFDTGELLNALDRAIDTRVEGRLGELVDQLSVRVAAELAARLHSGRRPGTESELLLTVPEAAKLLSLSRSTVYELIKRGEVEAVRVGGARRIRRDALEAFHSSLSDRGQRPEASSHRAPVA